MQWLSNISEADAGRPPLSNSGSTIRIVENWEAPKDPEASSRTIHVYTNAPLGEGVVIRFHPNSLCSSHFLFLHRVAIAMNSFPGVEWRGRREASARRQLWGRAAYVSSQVCARQADRESTGLGRQHSACYTFCEQLGRSRCYRSHDGRTICQHRHWYSRGMRHATSDHSFFSVHGNVHLGLR